MRRDRAFTSQHSRLDRGLRGTVGRDRGEFVRAGDVRWKQKHTCTDEMSDREVFGSDVRICMVEKW